MKIENKNRGGTQRAPSDFIRSEASHKLEERRMEADPKQSQGETPAQPMMAAFLEKTLSMLKPATPCCAWIVEVDLPEEQSMRADVAARTAAVETSIDAFCRQANGFWHKIETIRFAAIFPGATPGNATDDARRLKNQIQAKHAGTVTIGIAAHPTPGFTQKQILVNAEKALCHAAFFGPDSMVVFDSVSLNIRGDRYYENGDIAGAIAEFEAGLLLNPEDPNLRNSLGVCHGLLQRYDLAKTEFEKAMQLQPDNVMPVYNAGLTEMLSGNRESALTFFEKAAQVGGDAFTVSLQTGRCLLELDRPEDALAHLEKAEAAQPQNGFVHSLIGQCFEKRKRFQPAIQALKKAVKINPSDAAALSLLGWIFHRVGENPDIALLFCQKSVEVDPTNALYRQRLGTVLKSCGQAEAAAEELRTAAKLGIDIPKNSTHNVRQKTGTADP